MTEYDYTSPPDITARIKGKTIESVSIDDSRGDDQLVIHFTDGSAFRLRYDWIYEWDYEAAGVNTPRSTRAL